MSIQNPVNEFRLFVRDFLLPGDLSRGVGGDETLEDEGGDVEVEDREGVVEGVVGGDGAEGEHYWREGAGGWERWGEGVEEGDGRNGGEEGFADYEDGYAGDAEVFLGAGLGGCGG